MYAAAVRCACAFNYMWTNKNDINAPRCRVACVRSCLRVVRRRRRRRAHMSAIHPKHRREDRNGAPASVSQRASGTAPVPRGKRSEKVFPFLSLTIVETSAREHATTHR